MPEKCVTVSWWCDICGKHYPKMADAEACESRGVVEQKGFQVGDIVLVRAGFGWFDGDVAWVENYKRNTINGVLQRNPEHGNCFGECCTYRFYYVLTAITPDTGVNGDLHRLIYHLETLAMTGQQGYRKGYTVGGVGHVTMEKPKHPPPAQVVEEAKALVGNTTDILI